MLTAAAEADRERGVPIAPRDDQFIYTSGETLMEAPWKPREFTRFVTETWRSVDGTKKSWIDEDGKGHWSEPDPTAVVWPPLAWEELRALPTDPERLIHVLREKPGAVPRPGVPLTAADWNKVYFNLTELLRQVPLMPEGLRPAAFEALAKVPGIRKTNGVMDSLGRKSVGITRPDDPRLGDSTLLFDARSNAYHGTHEKRPYADGGGTYDRTTTFRSFAVVDKAKQRPAGRCVFDLVKKPSRAGVSDAESCGFLRSPDGRAAQR